MTLAEFKAWFSGYTEGMESAPNQKQWERIKERVKEIDGTITSYPVFVDRYFKQWPQQPYWYSSQLSVSANGAGQLSNADQLKAYMSNCSLSNPAADAKLDANQQTRVYNSNEAFRNLGKAEAAK